MSQTLNNVQVSDEFEDIALVDDVDQGSSGHAAAAARTSNYSILAWYNSFFRGKAVAQGFQPLQDHDESSPSFGCSRAKWCPEENCTILSKLLFLFPNSLMELGCTKAIEDTDLWDLASGHETAHVYSRYEEQLQNTASLKYPNGSVWSALFRAFGKYWAAAGLMKLIHDCINLSSPYILRQLLLHKKAGADKLTGLGWAVALFFSGSTVAVLVNQYFLRVFRVSLQIKASLVHALYTKLLRLSLPAKTTLGGGSIANLQSNDAAKLWNLPQFGHILWSGPFQVFAIMFLLHKIVGWPSMLAGLATTILLVPLNLLVGKVVHRLRKDLIAKTDIRVKLMSEIINGVHHSLVSLT
jgi:ATP-binding cassette subfamily C (CFTR/MRP) protein 1